MALSARPALFVAEIFLHRPVLCVCGDGLHEVDMDIKLLLNLLFNLLKLNVKINHGLNHVERVESIKVDRS
jgi:hypothetical protein